MKRFLLVFLSVLVAAFAVFFLTAVITDYRPDSVETVYNGGGVADILPDTVRMMTWNIGYAGLGDNMDFFYDGGTKVRDTEERTRMNMDSIIAVIRKADPDICLLQEVDVCSHRTYRIDMLERLCKEFPGYTVSLGYNYKSFFVPIPLSSPVGKVASGVVTLSRYRPAEVLRYSYPSRFPFPVSMFNLKRCLLMSEYVLEGGRRFFVGNTHNTAYDTDNMRAQEVDFLAGLAAGMYEAQEQFVIAGDWNQYPEGYVPSASETDNPCFAVAGLPMGGLGQYGKTVFDTDAKTLRYLDRVYGPESVTTVTDFYYVSDGLGHGSADVLDQNYRFSDHQPVVMTIYF